MFDTVARSRYSPAAQLLNPTLRGMGLCIANPFGHSLSNPRHGVAESTLGSQLSGQSREHPRQVSHQAIEQPTSIRPTHGCACHRFWISSMMSCVLGYRETESFRTVSCATFWWFTIVGCSGELGQCPIGQQSQWIMPLSTAYSDCAEGIYR